MCPHANMSTGPHVKLSTCTCLQCYLSLTQVFEAETLLFWAAGKLDDIILPGQSPLRSCSHDATLRCLWGRGWLLQVETEAFFFGLIQISLHRGLHLLCESVLSWFHIHLLLWLSWQQSMTQCSAAAGRTDGRPAPQTAVKESRIVGQMENNKRKTFRNRKSL